MTWWYFIPGAVMFIVAFILSLHQAGNTFKDHDEW